MARSKLDIGKIYEKKKVPSKRQEKPQKFTTAIRVKGKKKKALDGKKLSPNFSQNCLTCFNFYNCRDPEKSRAFLCSKYSSIEDHMLEGPKLIDVEEEEASSRKKIIKYVPINERTEEEEEENLQSFLMNIVNNPEMSSEEDFIFDDSDLLSATNFLQWTASKNFLGEKPFPKQVEVGINLLQEYCPYCSNVDWITNIPKSTSLNSIRENAELLRHGKCPSCKKGKAEMVEEGDLFDYYELVGLAGQRCITGKSLVLTVDGVFPIEALLSENPEGFSKYEGPDLIMEDGSPATPSQAFVGFDNVVKIVLETGETITCTKIHPLMTPNGFVNARNLNVGDELSIFFSNSLWNMNTCPNDIVSSRLQEPRSSKIFEIKEIEEKRTVYDFHIPFYNRFMANGILNHNSGKTAVASYLSSYSTHQFLKMPNPARAFNLTRGMQLTGTFAAVTLQQAQQNVWNPYIKPQLTSSAWFNEYLKMLDDYAERNGTPLYKIMDTYIRFFHKSLFLSAYTPDKRTLRGASRFLALIDELGWFTTQIGKASAVKADGSETLSAMVNSLGTLIQSHELLRKKGYDYLPQPLMLNISSPSSTTDPICTRYEQAQQEEQKIYSFHYPTWEFSPYYERNSPQIVSAFGLNKITANRDWGAEPPLSSSPLFDNPSIFNALVNEKKSGRKNLFIVEREKYTSVTGALMTSARVRCLERDVTNRILTLDAGSINNSFSMAMGRCDPETGYPVLEGLAEIVPFDGREINFTDLYYNVIGIIIEKFGVINVSADRWQSKKILQDIETDFEIETDEYSLKLRDFINYRDAVVDGSFVIPKPEMEVKDIVEGTQSDYRIKYAGKPVAHFISQNLTVQKTLKSVEKGAKLTDDLFRAVVLLHTYLSDPDIKDQFMTGPELTAAPKKLGLGIAISQPGSGISKIEGVGFTSGLSSGLNGVSKRTFSGK